MTFSRMVKAGIRSIVDILLISSFSKTKPKKDSLLVSEESDSADVSRLHKAAMFRFKFKSHMSLLFGVGCLVAWILTPNPVLIAFFIAAAGGPLSLPLLAVPLAIYSMVLAAELGYRFGKQLLKLDSWIENRKVTEENNPKHFNSSNSEKYLAVQSDLSKKAEAQSALKKLCEAKNALYDEPTGCFGVFLSEEQQVQKKTYSSAVELLRVKSVDKFFQEIEGSPEAKLDLTKIINKP